MEARRLSKATDCVHSEIEALTNHEHHRIVAENDKRMPELSGARR